MPVTPPVATQVTVRRDSTCQVKPVQGLEEIDRSGWRPPRQRQLPVPLAAVSLLHYRHCQPVRAPAVRQHTRTLRGHTCTHYQTDAHALSTDGLSRGRMPHNHHTPPTQLAHNHHTATTQLAHEHPTTTTQPPESHRYCGTHHTHHTPHGHHTSTAVVHTFVPVSTRGGRARHRLREQGTPPGRPPTPH